MIDFIERLLSESSPIDEFIVGVPAKREAQFLKESLSALANHEGGGYIFYGIGSRLGFLPYRKSQARTERIVRTIAENALTPPVNVTFESCTYKGNPILAVIVAPSLVKPVCLKDQTPIKAFYRANGETQLLSRSAIGRLMIETTVESPDTAFFHRPWTLSEVTTALSFRMIREALSLEEASLDSDVLIVLEREGLVRPSGTSYWVKKLALLLFHSEFHLPFVENEFPKSLMVVTTSEMEKRPRRREKLFIRGLAEAPKRALEYLTNQKTRDIKTLPVTAITEAIINAACYTDFNQFDHRKPFLRLELGADCLWIESQGDCSLSPDRIFDRSGNSANPELGKWLRRLYPHPDPSAQKGLLNMLAEVESLRLPPPEFRISEEGFDVTLPLRPFSEFQELSSSQRKQACYQLACQNASKHRPITNRSLRYRLRADPDSYPRCSRIIAQLLRDKKLIRVGGSKSNRDAAYMPYWYRAVTV